MTNLRMFRLRYLPATNNKPARLRIIDTRFERSVIINRHYEVAHFREEAIAHLANLGINVTAQAFDERTKEDYLFTEDFETMLREDRK